MVGQKPEIQAFDVVSSGRGLASDRPRLCHAEIVIIVRVVVSGLMRV